jgi:hypothetical protein
VTDIARTIAALGDAVSLPLSVLLLDADNPRLPDTMQGQAQEDLAVDMALGFDAFTVAESIASHGYFTSEPLIAIPVAEGFYTVVEGNRRLAALLGLTRPDIRSQFADAERWARLAEDAAIPDSVVVPVVVAPNRQAVTPIIGYRHISGILQWQAYAQARYVSKLIDGDGMDYGSVAEMIGLDRTKVANLYRDQAVAVQARDLGIDTGGLEKSFSLLTVAMSSPKLRDHVGAPLGSHLLPGAKPIPEAKVPELRELLQWVYGEGAIQPVIDDSREIAKLGNVVASPIGLKALRDGETLEHAIQRVKDAAEDPHGRLLKRLRAGKNSLTAALDDAADFADVQDVRELIEASRSAVEALEAAVGDT